MPQFKYFNVKEQSNGVTLLEINRPRKHNSFNQETWEEYYKIFQYLSRTNTKVIILYGIGKNFCSGIDLSSIKSMLNVQKVEPESIVTFQKCINAPVEFSIPVISISHGISYGLAIDIISATTIRLATKDVRFAIKEIDIGIMADIGSLQRLPLITGNSSKINELALTARDFGAEEAEKVGLVSNVFETKEEALKKASEIAGLISSKYVPAVKGTKKHLELMNVHSAAAKEGLVKVSQDNAELMNDPSYSKYFLKKFGKMFAKL